MEQQLRCTRVDHGELILSICISSSCNANPRIFCIKCLKTIHAQCNNQFYHQDEFITKLIESKQAHKPKDISEVTEALKKIVNSIKTLEQFVKKVLEKYEHNQTLDQIEQILHNQNTLSANDWKKGYELISAKPAAMNKKLMDLTNQLTHIIMQIDQTTSLVQEQIMDSDWNNITIQKPLIIQVGYPVYSIALSPEGKYVASVGGLGEDFSIKIWDPLTGLQVGNPLKGHQGQIFQINYSRCGNFIVSGSQDQTIRQWSTVTQQQISQPIIGHDKFVYGVQYTSDQKFIMSCSDDKTIRLWQSNSGKEEIDKRIKHVNEIYCLSLSPIQSHVVFGDKNGLVAIWDYEIHQQRGQSLLGHSLWINQVQYSKNGQFLITVSEDKTIILWDAISVQQIKSFLGHKESVRSVSFSPDMKYLISGGADMTVRIWNRLTGKQIGKALNHGSVYSTQFSLNGKYIITGDCYSISIIVTPVQIEQQQNEGCSLF